MMKTTLAFGALFCCVIARATWAVGIAPEVVEDPYDPTKINKVVKFQVTSSDDRSWMFLPFIPAIDPTAHDTITVSFDVYRIRDAGATNDTWAEWFAWGWTNVIGELDDIVPSYGGQYQSAGYADGFTFPFIGAGYTTGTASTVYDRYTAVMLEWDMVNKYISSEYAGSSIDINQLLVDPGTALNGFIFDLTHISGLAEGDVLYIDNFVITGSDIYNSNGFQDFDLGPLNGQDGWIAGNEASAVPEPATLALFGLGLAGLAGMRRKKLAA